MKYDFDSKPNRKGTGAQKWDQFEDDAIPMWVADMDFASPPEIFEAIRKRAEHPYLGYTIPDKGLTEATIKYLKEKHNCEAKEKWFRWTPGVVPGLHLVASVFSNPDESVMFCTPAYPPFFKSVNEASRTIITTPLKIENGRWTFDFEAMQRDISPKTKIFFLCNPHNPVGRVYTREELEKVAEFCIKHDLLLLSDEIHSDLIYSGHEHIMIRTLSPEIAERTITFIAPSKTYNTAGLTCSLAIVSNMELQTRFKEAGRWMFINVFGYTACEVAYRKGEPWRKELMHYLEGNRDFLYKFIRERIPEIKLKDMEGTYIAWLNVEWLKERGVEDTYQYFIDNGVRPLNGMDFGDENHQRLNFACPRYLLEEALNRIEAGVKNLR